MNVLIVNSQNWLGLSRLPSTLHRAGCRISVFGPGGGAIMRSRLVEHFFWASAEVETLLDELRKHLEEDANRYQWVIFGDEPALAAAATRRDESWIARWLPVSAQGESLELILSKAPFAIACQKAGIPFPKTKLCHSWPEVDNASQEIGFPLILKNPLGNGGWGVRKCNHPAELREFYEPWSHIRPLLVQQFMKGRVGACEMLYDHGKLLCWFSSYIIKCWPDTYGPSSVREVMIHPQIEPMLIRIGEMLGYHGLCGIDWFHDPDDDSLVCLEFNARPTTCYHLGRFAGVDFAHGIESMLHGQQLIQRPVLHGGRRPMVYLFPQHIFRCLGTRDLGDLVHWLPGMGLHDVPWNEPRMMLRHLLRIGRLTLRLPIDIVRGVESPSS